MDRYKWLDKLTPYNAVGIINAILDEYEDDIKDKNEEIEKLKSKVYYEQTTICSAKDL